MDTAVEVLETIKKCYGVSYVNIAKRTGIGISKIYLIRNGECKISRNAAEKIVKTFPELNLEWLLTAEGEIMFDFKEGSTGEVNILENLYNGAYAPFPDNTAKILLGFQTTIKEQQSVIKLQQNQIEKLIDILIKLNSEKIDVK